MKTFLNTECPIKFVKSVQIRRFFWSVFSRIRTEYGGILRISPYFVRMWENTDQKNLRVCTLFKQRLSLEIYSFYSNHDRKNVYLSNSRWPESTVICLWLSRCLFHAYSYFKILKFSKFFLKVLVGNDWSMANRISASTE